MKHNVGNEIVRLEGLNFPSSNLCWLPFILRYAGLNQKLGFKSLRKPARYRVSRSGASRIKLKMQIGTPLTYSPRPILFDYLSTILEHCKVSLFLCVQIWRLTKNNY